MLGEVPCGCASCVDGGRTLSPSELPEADNSNLVHSNTPAIPQYVPWVLAEDHELSDAGDDYGGGDSDGDNGSYASSYSFDEGENFFG